MSDLVKATIDKVEGFKVAGVHAGLKADGALDMAIIYSDYPCAAAGVFTTNKVKAAPVLVDQEILAKNNTHIRAVVVNTKCANASTGQQGIDNARQMARWAAERLSVAEDEVLVMSTGVIGTQLNLEKIKHGIDLAAESLGDDWDAAARAIMTTDTRPKQASLEWKGASIAGIAKGAGMIAPNMATMLGIVVTNGSVSPELLQKATNAAADKSFNRITVDGDMSTNDTLLVLSNGRGTDISDSVSSLVEWVCTPLAKAIVRDGEGATKFIVVNVQGAESDADARQIADTIATSPLVKTAFYGGDANWGRIVAAAGRAGVPFDPDKSALWVCPGEVVSAAPQTVSRDGETYTYVPPQSLQLFGNGVPLNYSEAQAAEIMQSPDITISLTCGLGYGQSTVWTCDLSHDYVSINGHYRS